MADTVTAEAARVPRVSAATFSAICDRAAYDAQLDDATTFQMIALDSRDKDATIADLKRRLADARATSDELFVEAETAAGRLISEAARADALQVQLAEAEQRAATAERRGFEAGREADGLPDEATPQILAAGWAAINKSRTKPVDMAPGPALREAWPEMLKAARKARALAPAVPQEGETTR